MLIFMFVMYLEEWASAGVVQPNRHEKAACVTCTQTGRKSAAKARFRALETTAHVGHDLLGRDDDEPDDEQRHRSNASRFEGVDDARERSG